MSSWHAARSAETRRRLSEAAVSLFATKGYDNTTAAEIAELANVTERTFFLHFPTKADAVVDLQPPLLDEFFDLIVEQPESYDDVTVLEEALIAWHIQRGELDRVHRDVKLVHAAAASSQTLRGRQFDGTYKLASVASDALAARAHIPEPTLEMRVTSEVAMRLLHAILTEWIAGPPDQLEAIARSYFDALRTAATGWATIATR